MAFQNQDILKAAMDRVSAGAVAERANFQFFKKLASGAQVSLAGSLKNSVLTTPDGGSVQLTGAIKEFSDTEGFVEVTGSKEGEDKLSVLAVSPLGTKIDAELWDEAVKMAHLPHLQYLFSPMATAGAIPQHTALGVYEQGSHTFWQRHGFGRLSRRRVQGLAADETLSPVAKPSYKASWDAAQDMARRAPAHVNDAIQAVLEGPGGTEAPKFATPRLKPPKGELYFDSYEVPGDWTDPQVAGFNSMTAGAHRQHKWEHQHQYFPMALKDEAARVEHVFGFDEEDAMMASGALKLEAAAGGGAGIAKRLLSTQDASGQPSWRELFALAPRAEAACFEMPKETALHVALCLEHAARAAEAEALGRAAAAASLEIPFIQDAEEAADSEAAEGLLRAEAAARLRQAAVALLAASATRARDAHSYDFPMAGLEALVSTGLGWAAFSDMFLASLFAQLQRMSSMQPQVRRMVTMEPSIAKRLKSVFIAAFEQGEGQLELGPAGRNLAAAARHALSEACALDEHSGALLVKLSSRGEHPKLPNMALL